MCASKPRDPGRWIHLWGLPLQRHGSRWRPMRSVERAMLRGQQRAGQENGAGSKGEELCQRRLGLWKVDKNQRDWMSTVSVLITVLSGPQPRQLYHSMGELDCWALPACRLTAQELPFLHLTMHARGDAYLCLQVPGSHEAAYWSVRKMPWICLTFGWLPSLLSQGFGAQLSPEL